MISFKCPKCGKAHTARESAAGRRGFCSCGAVMVVPEVEEAIQHQTPKVIGDLDFNAGKRNVIHITVAGIAAAAIIAVAIFCYKGSQKQAAYEAAQSAMRNRRDELAAATIKAREERDAANPPPLVWSPPRQADTSGMTYDNYLKMTDDMDSLEVYLLLGMPDNAENSKSGSLKTVTYRGKDGSEVIVTYQNDKLVSKLQSGLK